jgi:hypothetical protein
MDTITQEQAFPYPKNDKNYCTSKILQYQISTTRPKKKGKEKLTIYAQRLPIIISYLNIPIQRQSELAKAPKWPVSQKQLPSSLPANANLPVIFFST